MEVDIKVALSSIAGKYDVIWAYFGATQSWKLYTPDNTPNSDLMTIDENMGIWVHATEDCILDSTIPLYLGWNLVTSSVPRPINITPPAASKVINSSIDIAPIFLLNEFLQKAYLNVTEGYYEAIPLSEIDRFVNAAHVDAAYLPFVDDKHECGKFAAGLVGKFCATPGWWDTPIGILQIADHQMCVGVGFKDDSLTKLEGFILEPQTKERWPISAITQQCCQVYMP